MKVKRSIIEADVQRTLMFIRIVCTRVSRQNGFTLVELVIVLCVLGILMMLAAPSYLAAKARASDTAAKANIRAAVTAVEMFALDNDGTKGDADGKKGTLGYKGLTTALLRAKYDAGISPLLTVVSGKTTQSTYCLAVSLDSASWSALGPGIDDLSFRSNAKCK